MNRRENNYDNYISHFDVGMYCLLRRGSVYCGKYLRD